MVQPVDWADATPALAAELIAFCKANLSAYKAPKSIDFDPAPPHASQTGKLYKMKVRARYLAGGLNRPGRQDRRRRS